MRSRKHLGLAFIAVATIGAGTVGFMSTTAGADDYGMKATSLDVNGTNVGRVKFSSDEHHTSVKVRLTGAPGATAFHGFHIHASNDPANGEGCVAAGKFVSADGHFKASWSEPWPAHRRPTKRVCENRRQLRSDLHP